MKEYFILVFMGVLLSCKAKPAKRPNSSEAMLLGGGMMVSWVPASLVS